MVAVVKGTTQARDRRPWERPELQKVGTISEVLRGGGGKASASSADSGDAGKPRGQA